MTVRSDSKNGRVFIYGSKKWQLGARAIKRVAAGAHLPTFFYGNVFTYTVCSEMFLYDVNLQRMCSFMGLYTYIRVFLRNCSLTGMHSSIGCARFDVGFYDVFLYGNAFLFNAFLQGNTVPMVTTQKYFRHC